LSHFTEWEKRGERSFGQNVKEIFGDNVFIVGTTTYQGEILAANQPGHYPPEVMTLNPALDSSWENMLKIRHPSYYLLFSSRDPQLEVDEELISALKEIRPERAIGSVYFPTSEEENHYFTAQLGHQFDALIHISKTNALQHFEWRNAKRNEGMQGDIFGV